MTKCAAIQMTSGASVEANLVEAERLTAEAARQGARLVIFPENFSLMGQDERDKLAFAEDDGIGPIQDFLARVAQQYSVWLVAGTIAIKASTPDKVRAASLLYDDQGQRIARYDKIHLFDVHVPETGEEYRESGTIDAGIAPVVVDTPFGRLGLAVCYDVRFPELFRQMLDLGMEILSVPSAFTAATGAAHWELLIRARAVENLCYVIAPNQGGTHANGRQTYGNSMIVDPWGKVLAVTATGSAVVLAEIDRNRLTKVRGAFPVLDHRRLVCAYNGEIQM